MLSVWIKAVYNCVMFGMLTSGWILDNAVQ